ncbi:hypothetical protein KUTeg_023193 [Tegillarca granosa]|uniref:Fatty acyl-CoA reductase n=1 Tax=Tegillarca granosa TaxID=220873 RepID=A0ABQ9E100_TEGGR|nr:hypothetical protein KUTeg_023193 [Tegillarca granosa]
MINMNEQEVLPTIAEYYARKNVFITGATGFIGKVLIEKLIRSCPDIGNIYILIRPKRNQDIYQRCKELFDCPIYDKIREKQPNFQDKICLIHGDVCEPGLGIKQTDLEILEEKVNIVFHGAATIRFDEHLRKMVNICRKFKNLEVFVHISTAYANCDRPFIEEIVYNPPVEPQKLIDAIEWMDDEMIEAITPKLIGNKPNTYTYTKQLAEYLLVKEGADLPLAIVRPSIVGAAWKEPLPGWIDNYNGPSGLYIASGKGILRSMKVDHSAVADIIPVDIPVNAMIAVAWHTVVTKPSNVLIYHSTTGNVNPFTWGEMEPVIMNFWKKVPLDSCFRRPKVALTQNGLVHDYWVFVSHMIPAYIADLGFCLLGKRPRMVKIYNKLHKAISILTYFTMHSWEWSYSNTELLKNSLSPEDKKLFYLDARGLHWPTYIESCLLGTKKFILKQNLSDLPAARAHIRKLRNIRYCFNTFVIIAAWRLLIARSEIARNMWFFIIGLVLKFVRFFRLTSSVSR